MTDSNRGKVSVARSTKVKAPTEIEAGTRQRPASRPTPKRAPSNATVTSRRNSGAPRSLIAATAVCFILALGLLGWELSEPWRNGPAAVSGQIARPFGGGVAVVDASTGAFRELVRGPASAVTTAVAWSPDRSKLAYTVFHKRPEDRISSAELFVVPAAGGTPAVLVPRDQPGSIVDAPVWSPDGQSIFFTYMGVVSGKPVARIDRVTVADGTRQPLYDGGSFPAPSSDGRNLAFIYDDGRAFSLRVGTVDGGDARQIVPSDTFVGMAGPRFSPDGSRIAFTAFNPRQVAPPAQPGQTVPPAQPAQPPRGDAGGTPIGQSLVDFVLGVRVAEAHGDPWGIWTVRPDGGDLKLATPLTEDEPLVAWSPSGDSLAVHSAGGLWIVDMRGTTEPKRIADGAIGAIDW